MDYQKPGILNSFLTNDLYGAASGFASAPGDDSPGLCGHDTQGPGADTACL